MRAINDHYFLGSYLETESDRKPCAACGNFSFTCLISSVEIR